MKELIEPKEIEIEVSDGVALTYTLSKFPAIPGRKIVTQYPLSAIPKVGDYAVNEEIMFLLIAYVGFQPKEGDLLLLNSRALIDNHIPNWEVLARLEVAMLEYNCSFFREGKVSTFLDDMTSNLPALISSILTHLLEQSSQKTPQPSTS